MNTEIQEMYEAAKALLEETYFFDEEAEFEDLRPVRQQLADAILQFEIKHL